MDKIEKAVEIMLEYFPDIDKTDFGNYLTNMHDASHVLPDDTRYLVFKDWSLCVNKEEALYEEEEEFRVRVYSSEDDLRKIWHLYRDEMEVYDKFQEYYLNNNSREAKTEEELNDILQEMLDDGWEGVFFIEEYPAEAKNTNLGALDLIDGKYYQFNGLGEKFEYGEVEEWKLDWRQWFVYKGDVFW